MHPSDQLDDLELLKLGQEVLRDEAQALEAVAGALGANFIQSVRQIESLRGRLVVSGMGKANFVGQKLSATFASTGTPSFFLHPADALHGDLGRLTEDDLLLALSHSGETEELNRLVPLAQQLGTPVIAMTASEDSTLGKASKLVLPMGRWAEAGSGLAPTTSTTVMLALGDALAMAVLKLRDFTAQDFARFHPAGALGRKLMKVQELMRQGAQLPVVEVGVTLAEALRVMTQTPGRPGATMVVEQGVLQGIFTDGDLRRLVESGQTGQHQSIESVMSPSPRTVSPGQRVVDAAQVLRSYGVDQLPVVEEDGRLVGLLDVQDLLQLKYL